MLSSSSNMGSDYQRRLRVNRKSASRVIAVAKVMEPSLVVQAFGDLDEHIQVVRAQVELPLRSSKEEAAVDSKLSLRILAPVAANFTRGRVNAYGQRAMRTAKEPDEHFAGTARQGAIDRRRDAEGIAEMANRFLRGGSDGNDSGHGLERSLEISLESEVRDQDDSE